MGDLEGSESAPDPEEVYLRLEPARRAHADHRSDIAHSFQATIQFALEAIRTSALINGGAVVAALAFAAALYQTRDGAVTVQLMWPISVFLLGVASAGVASGLAYIAQFYYTEALKKYELIWENPYWRRTDKAASLERRGTIWHVLSAVLVVGSYVALVTGAYLASSLFI